MRLGACHRLQLLLSCGHWASSDCPNACYCNSSSVYVAGRVGACALGFTSPPLLFANSAATPDLANGCRPAC